MERLIKSGASVETPDRNDLTPVDYAALNLGKQEGNKSRQKILETLEAMQRIRSESRSQQRVPFYPGLIG